MALMYPDIIRGLDPLDGEAALASEKGQPIGCLGLSVSIPRRGSGPRESRAWGCPSRSARRLDPLDGEAALASDTTLRYLSEQQRVSIPSTGKRPSRVEG